MEQQINEEKKLFKVQDLDFNDILIDLQFLTEVEKDYLNFMERKNQ